MRKTFLQMHLHHFRVTIAEPVHESALKNGENPEIFVHVVPWRHLPLSCARVFERRCRRRSLHTEAAGQVRVLVVIGVDQA